MKRFILSAIFAISSVFIANAQTPVIGIPNGNGISGGGGGAAAVSAIPGDIACAVANDLTVGARTPTGGSSTATTATLSGGVGFNFGYYPGELINVQGISPSGYNGTNMSVISVSGNSIVYANTNNPGAWVSSGTLSKYCTNQSADALVGTPYTFSNKFTVPAGWIQPGLYADFEAQFLTYTPAASPAALTAKLAYGTNISLWQNNTALVMAANASFASPWGGMLTWSLNGLTTGTAVVNLRSMTIPSSSTNNFYSNLASNAQPPITLPASATTIGPLVWWAPTGVVSATYVSGGTFSGTGSCGLATFNDSSTATGTIAVSSGTPGAITIISRGGAATAAPTTAVASNGTATCSGTITITSTLGGSPGNAIELITFTMRQQ